MQRRKQPPRYPHQNWYTSLGTPTDPHVDMAGPSKSQTTLDEDLRAMLQALPTRSDIEALILLIEEAHSRDIQEVKTELHSISDRVSTRETLITSLEICVLACMQQSPKRYSFTLKKWRTVAAVTTSG